MPALTYNDMLGAYAHYPAPIRPYLLRAETHPALRSILTKSFMRVVIDILGRAPIADPMRPLKLRADIIADNLDVSTKTVGRALGMMRKRGWLRRCPGHDGRNNWGEFCAGEFILGEDLRAMIGLPIAAANAKPEPCASEAMRTIDECSADSGKIQTSSGTPEYVAQSTDDIPAEQHASPVPHDATETSDIEGCGTHSGEQEMSADEQVPVDNPASGTKMSDGLYRVNKVFKKEASFQKGASSSTSTNQPKKPVIPGDLTSLQTELGIHPFGICKLMGLARDAKQRLQDVWIAKREHILNAQATGGRAVRYFEYLLQCGEDFSFVARQKAMKNRAPASAAEPARATPADHRIYWNKKFCGAHGVRVRIHGDGSAEITDGTRTDAYVMPSDMGPIHEAILLGKLWLVDE